MGFARRWLNDVAGGLPPTFWFLWAGNLINRSGGFVSVLLAFYLSDQRGFEPSYIGLVVGMIGAGAAAGAVIGGQLADRWGRRRTLLLAQFSTAAMLVVLGLTTHRWLVPAAGLLLGVAQSMARPAFAAMMVDVVSANDRLRAFNLNYWSNNLAFTSAALIGGLVATLDYVLIFVLNAATTLVAATVIAVKVGETLPATRDRVTHPSTARGAGNPLRDPVFLLLCVTSFLTSMVFMQYAVALPLSMSADGLTAATYGMIISINAVMIVFGQLFVPSLVRGRNQSHALAVASVIVGVGFALTALADTLWLYAVTVVVWTIGEMLSSPSSAALNADLSPTEARGRYQGTYMLSGSAAAFLAPIVGGLVVEHVGDRPLWLGCLVVGLLTAAVHIAASRSRERRIAALSAPPPVAVRTG
jgi:MFS family permease